MLPLRTNPALLASILGALLILVWWVGVVHFAYGGNWTGLYCHGSRFLVPDWLERQEVIFRDPSPFGYDGQIFHIMAHRPWPISDLAGFLQPPQLRIQRILIPALAYCVALGRQQWVDPVYFALVLLSLAAGVFWTARLASLRGASPWWGLAFLLLPSSLAAVDRMLVDGPLVALAAGLIFSWETGRWRWAALIAVAAPFVRETGLLLSASVALAAWARWGLPAGLRWSASALPFGLWSLWLSQLPGGLHTRFAGLFYSIRLLLAAPVPQTSPAWFGWLLAAAALLALACLLGASLRALIQCWRARPQWSSSPRAALWFCGALYAASAWVICHVEPRAAWDDFYAFGRVFSPMLLAVFLEWLACGKPALAAALIAASAARILLQFVSPALRIFRGLAGA